MGARFLEDIKALSVSCGPNHTAVVVKNADRLNRSEQQLENLGCVCEYEDAFIL